MIDNLLPEREYSIAMGEPATTVVYRSAVHPKQPDWDVMQVVYQQEIGGVKRIVNSFVIARDLKGRLFRKTDIILDNWEEVSDESELRGFQKCSDERDRLTAEEAAKQSEASA